MKGEINLFVPHKPRLPVPVLLAITIAGLIVPFLVVWNASSKTQTSMFIGIGVGLVGVIICFLISLRLAGVRASDAVESHANGSILKFKINYQYVFVVIAFLILIAPKMYSLAVAGFDAMATLDHLNTFATKSENHKKYMNEYIVCWWRPFASRKECVATLSKKYQGTDEFKDMKNVFVDAALMTQ